MRHFELQLFLRIHGCRRFVTAEDDVGRPRRLSCRDDPAVSGHRVINPCFVVGRMDDTAIYAGHPILETIYLS